MRRAPLVWQDRLIGNARLTVPDDLPPAARTAMDLFTRSHLNRLLDVSEDTCVSIYLPTHRTIPDARQDPIRFRNLLKAAERELAARELTAPRIQSRLRAATQWLGETEFWRHQSDGLAVFLSESTQQRYRLPSPFAEQVRVADAFHVTPLLPLLQSNGRFYLLAVSQKSCRLFSCHRDEIRQLEAAGLPRDLPSALGWRRERQLNLHSMQPRPQSRAGDATAVFHGHEEETRQIELAAYFRIIDAAVTDVLRGETAPLVFAGVEYLFPIYADVTRYRGLCDQAVTGNPDEATAEQLHRQAWELVRPLFERRQQEALREFHDRRPHATATDDVAAVLVAARNGLVETLLIGRGARLPGRFDAATGQVASVEGDSAEDLIDRAVLWTLRASGDVLTVDAEALPGGSTILALLRAPLAAVAR